jgi:polyhydroxyalkanoate synthase
VRFEVVPGGHLGMLTGRAARHSTWPLMDEWIDQWSSDDDAEPVDPPPRRKRSPSRDAIGANPRRRYGSSGSRALSR